MIQIISGVKGKGKTKYLIQKANEEVKTANGNVVYLDKNNKHMYELSNRIRLVNTSDYPLDNYDAFVGFICGMISQDNDLESLYLDSFLSMASVSEDYIGYVLNKLNEISVAFNVNMVISISVDSVALPENFKDNVIISL